MSTRMLLEEYLSLMRESGELDAFLPLLLTAMDHEIVTTPQLGHRQYGVDLLSRGPGDDGKTRLYLWIIKRGDIDRRVWSVGETSVRHSMQEAGDTYLHTHLMPADRELPKTVAVVTNGAFRQEIELEASTYMETWEKRYGGHSKQVPGSVLAKWADQYLLNEYALPPAHRSLFRKALATVETPEISYAHARELVVRLIDAKQLDGKSEPARRKRMLAALRAIRMVNEVLTLWGRDAQNLESPYLIAEFSVLHVWARLHTYDLFAKAGTAEFDHLIRHYTSIGDQYHTKLDSYYHTQAAFAVVCPDSSIVACRVFDQIGKIALQAVARAMLEDDSAAVFVARLKALITTHTISGSPCFDCQSSDISLGMLALQLGGENDFSKQWLTELVKRLGVTKKIKRFAPIDTDSFDDLMATRSDSAEHSMEFSRLSTLVPALGIWCARLNERSCYERLEKIASELFQGTTFNLWTPDATYESAFSDEAALQSGGIAECLTSMSPTVEEFMAQLSLPVPDIPAIGDYEFARLSLHWLPLMSARHWRKQIPWKLFAEVKDRASIDTRIDVASNPDGS